MWYFCFVSQKSGSITQRHVKMREESMLTVDWVVEALDFCFLWLFPSQQWRAEAGMAALHCSEQPGMPGPLWGGWAVGRHRAAMRALRSLLSPHYSMLAEKLINLRCFFAALGQFLFSVNLPNSHIQLNKHPGG